MSESRRGPLPPAFFLGALLLQVALHFPLPLTSVLTAPWNWGGSVPVLVGVGVMVLADAQFKKAQTAISPFDRPSALVCEGAFRISRNPMYAGMVLTLLGAGIMWGTVTPLLVPWLFGWFISSRFICLEEGILTDVFGNEYEEYRRRVRRWF
jgi:protein-S-isoprenylcysteine O-methyltransferase Ste14